MYERIPVWLAYREREGARSVSWSETQRNQLRDGAFMSFSFGQRDGEISCFPTRETTSSIDQYREPTKETTQ